ncbi:choice-of-anchor Q domain-containing protein [Spectribacter hydrogenoxidans]|uniref:Choice-of-anchor Q domain-containing protein n=1 Tax=Spectribacter hydrogenoxidans TaxID=3075608 RepID=A0ABU3C0N8_9GAMM|nr:choice-of-anchor Q domain-containing protein [Salinisphaera sp. W335]MDT0635114.1 choice-of-anchor Q domain-containing protein [Salinisphaera sp. W335]
MRDLRRYQWLRKGWARGAAAGGLLLFTTSGLAAEIVVDSLDDTVQDDSSCTLREAIISANTNVLDPTSGCAAGETLNGDNIVFTEGIAGGTITLNGTQLPNLGDVATSPLTITGPITIDAVNQSRIFTNAGMTTLDSLTLVNGMTATGNAPASDRSGGAILNVAGGVLTVNNGAMNNNTADRAGGAIEDESGATTAVTLNDVDFSGNDAGSNPGNGGVLHVTGVGGVVVNGGAFDGNMAVEGGALWNNQGSMTVDGATFTGNTASGGTADAGDATGQGGGAIFAENGAGSLTVMNSSFADNMAMGDVSSGGAIFANEGTTLSVSMSSFIGNMANRAGGAIETRANTSTTLDQVSLDGNTANTTAGGGGGNGGGLHVTGNGNVEIIMSEIVNNTAATEGGGLWNNTGTMTVDGSTVSNNTANGTGAQDGGGGIFNNAGGDDAGSGSVVVTSSVITGNRVPEGSGSGGGILNNFGGTLTVENSRISGNSAQRAGGGIETVGSTQVTLTVVDLSGNTTGPMPGNGGGLHVSGDGNVDVVNSFVGGNQAASEGGGLWNNTGVMNISGSSLVGNSALGNEATNGGGAVFNNNGDGSGNGTVNIRLSRIADNVASGDAGSGGGIFANTGGTVNVFDTRIESNIANRAGGGIESKDAIVNLSRVVLGGLSAAQGNDAGANPGNGGGLHVTGAGTTTVADSSVGYNVASEGGGLWNFNTGAMTVTNTTVSNNQALNPEAGGGGGVFQQPGEGSGMTSLQFTTVSRNMTAGNGGGVSAPGEGQMIDADDGTLIAENSAEGMGANVDGPGAVTENALVADMAGIDDLQLFGGRFDGPLDGIGDSGPTITATGVHPLQMDSAAIDGGPATCAPLTGDQRGAARPSGDNCDVGAFEAAGNPVLSLSNNNTGPIIVNSGDQVVFSVLAFGVTNNGDESITAGSLSGILEVDRIPAQPLDFANVDAELYVDDNGNGLADDGNEPVGSVDVNANGTFRVSFGTGGQAFAAGEGTNYVVTVALPGSGSGMADAGWQMPVFAGGTLLALLGLFSVGGLSRRLRWVLAIGVATVGLAACGGGNGGGLFNPPSDDEEPADLRFVAVTLDAPASVSTDDFLIGDGLPVRGPGINFDDN